MRFARAVSIMVVPPSPSSAASPTPLDAVGVETKLPPGTMKIEPPQVLLQRLLKILERCGHYDAPETTVINVMREVDGWDAVDDATVTDSNGLFVLTEEPEHT